MKPLQSSSTCNRGRAAMGRKPVFDVQQLEDTEPSEQKAPGPPGPQAVIVEIGPEGGVRIRECPPHVTVMVVESTESAGRIDDPSRPAKRSIGAGRRNGARDLSRERPPQRRPDIREIAVRFTAE